MRKVLFSLLLVSIAILPALAAQPGKRGDEGVQPVTPPERAPPKRERPRAEERRSERPAASFSAAPAREGGRVSRDSESHEQVRERIVDLGEAEQLGGNVNARGRPTLPRTERGGAAAAQWRHRDGPSDGVAQWRENERRQWHGQRPGVFSSGERFQRTVPPVGARRDFPAPAPKAAQHRDRSPQWASHWRHDRRYDWREHRRRNSSLFHIGIYYDPFGWNYRRHGIGWRLWPSHYHRRYWLGDPWSYRLPYAPWPYQWVRYWDDAVLVNTVTGQIVDIEYNVFW